MDHSAEIDAVLRVLSDHAWERSVYTDHAPPHASIGHWGWRCPCGTVVKGESAHREHVAEAIIAARVLPPGEEFAVRRMEDGHLSIIVGDDTTPIPPDREEGS